MRTMHRGRLVIEHDGDVSGMIAGDVVVRAGVRARIAGMVSGDVVIEDGADVQVSGMVAGRIVGSPAAISGMVGGR